MAFLSKKSNKERVGGVAEKLRKKQGILRFLEAHNGLGGLIVDDVKIDGRGGVLEFDGFWESSFTDSASKGLPDIEIVSPDSRLDTINQIMEVTRKPMIVDGDTGGDINQFERLVKRLENAGVSMVVIEDKIFPKRNSLEPGTKQELENPALFAEKIKKGQAAKTNKDFLLVARVESLIAGMGMKDAMDRAKTYLKAGADGILIHSKKEIPDEILEFAKKFQELPENLRENKILICVPTTYNTITEQELEKAGFNIVIYANHLLRASYLAMEKAAKEILKKGRSFEVNPYCASVKEIFEKVGFLEIKKKDEEMARKFGSKVKVIIPAAGRDFLSEKYQRPRALIDINGKSILQRQIETLRRVGLNNLAVIKGYKGELFNIENIHYYNNPNYEKEYVLSSLFRAREFMDSPFIFTYGDILFNEAIIRNLLEIERGDNPEDIVLVVDNSFQYHKHKLDKRLDLVKIKNKNQDSVRKIVDAPEEEISFIGKKIDEDAADYEFAGIAYFSEAGTKILKDVYDDSLKQYSEKRFHEAENIWKADFTDLIQEIIDRGYKVRALKTYKGWMEVHNEDDLNLVKEL
jgi:phosphoenolpyruvate phosphomutase